MLTKKYEFQDQKDLNKYLEVLTGQFNYIRQKKSIVVDPLLEIIAQLRELKKK